VPARSPGLLAGNPPPRWGAPGEDLAQHEVCLASVGYLPVAPKLEELDGRLRIVTAHNAGDTREHLPRHVLSRHLVSGQLLSGLHARTQRLLTQLLPRRLSAVPR